MHLSIRTKLGGLIVAILLFAMGANTLISTYIFTKEYTLAIQSKVSAVGESLKLQLERLLGLGLSLEELLGFENQCQEIVAKYPEISAAMVAASDGKILFHNDPGQHGNLVTAVVGAQNHAMRTIELPVSDAMLQKQIATIIIVYPVEIITEKTQDLILSSVVVAVISLIMAIVLLWSSLVLWITKPLQELSQASSQLSKGEVTSQLRNMSANDEIGILFQSFAQLILYFREMAHVVSEIAQGNLAEKIQPKSKNDVLGQASLNMLNYLHQIAAVMQKIAEGDLAATISLRSSKDAFGKVLHTMNTGLRGLVTQIRMNAERIASAGATIASLSTQDIGIVQNVTTSVEHMVSTMNNLQASVEDVSHNMQTLSSSVEYTSTSVSEMTTSIGQIASNTTALTQQTHATIAIVNQTMESLEEIVKTIDISRQLSQNTAQDAVDGQQAVAQVISSMDTIYQTVMTSVDAITRFSQRSQDIDAILEVIHNITAQTSLLALNASIIAAQAGAHGRGFAVVADEMKNLSSGVEASTKDIASIVQSLKQDTADVVKTIHDGAAYVKQGVEHTQQARATLQNIIDSAQHSSSVVTDIAETLHTLRQTSGQIVSAMQTVDVMTNEITVATKQQKLTTEQIHQAIADIHEMAEHTSKTTDEQLRGVQQILHVATDVTRLIEQNLESSHRITQASQEFSSQAQLLVEEVKRFKLENG